MDDEARLAVWRWEQQDHDRLLIAIDLDPGLSAVLTIERDGRLTTTLSGPVASWLQPENRSAA